jgi:NitT/TauT family transport system substrate-binding protein
MKDKMDPHVPPSELAMGKKMPRTFLHAVIALACALATGGPSGCKRPDAAPGATAQPAPATPPASAAPASDYGKPGDPVHLVVGFQPYYAEAWSGVVVNGLGLWKKYLPPQSTVEFKVGLQGAIIVNAMLAGKQQIGYLGDMPSIVGATKRSVADLRIIANIGLSHDQCNIFLARTDAPKFADATAALKWLDGKTVAVPKGSCTDRFARAVFKKQGVNPADYLNQNIELITSGFRSNKLDGAVVWEPTASRLVAEGLARRVATGNDFGENDAAFIDARADLIKQRPDVIKGWLQAELEAELYLADPKNGHAVAGFAKEQTTGFEEKVLWQALFGRYPASVGGSSTRLSLPFGFTPASHELIKRATAFLYEMKSIDVPELAADAIQPQFAEEILKERGLTAPVGEIKASAEVAVK